MLVGVQTYDIRDPAAVQALDILDWSIIGVFCAEFLIKVVAEGSKPWLYFHDRWNVFDFLILILSVLPFGGQAIVALRLIRLGRVLKLVRALPQLRILVQGLASAFGSIGYIGLLLLLSFYLFAVSVQRSSDACVAPESFTCRVLRANACQPYSLSIH